MKKDDVIGDTDFCMNMVTENDIVSRVEFKLQTKTFQWLDTRDVELPEFFIKRVKEKQASIFKDMIDEI